MLIRFSVENWMSFRDETTLNMIATREKQHSNHVAKTGKLDFGILPVSAIYGANASGKSNFVKALYFVQRFVTNPPKQSARIPVSVFRLDKDFNNRPTTFHIEILIEDDVYDYKFSVNSQKVLEEELKRFGKTEQSLFHRVAGQAEVKLSHVIKDQERQQFAYRGTNDNQLFLTNSVLQKLEEFKPVFDWFDETLQIIFPGFSYGNLFGITSESHRLHSKMIDRMRNLDSGISLLRHENIPAESIVPKSIIDRISTDLNEGTSLDLPGGESLIKENGLIVGRRLVPIHCNEKGEEVLFSLPEESEGTQRLFDILPAFLFLEENRPKVFVIDELDRSLHPTLTMTLLVQYLESRDKKARSQLIFTTHDTYQMDQKRLFRRDEIWITERDQTGASTLLSFSEFKDVRNDKDIRKSYLQGRMGGVPRIKVTSVTCNSETEVGK
jgi:uncharacterized protein